MDNILSFYVFSGTQWLADDERSWTEDFHSAACFTSWELADDIAKRESVPNAPWYVLGCMATR